jgi:nitroimidazol reductase NimA-like FMN-containing flavoprotein (pyridoxamine 5'-phosphate oxidase superfamily)
MSDETRAPGPPSERTRVRRIPERGRYDRETIDSILDEALVCHLGFVDDGRPFVIPTLHARVGDELFVHGSTASRMLRALSDGTQVCVTVTLLDGIVLARSAFESSVNYRSVVVLGSARVIDDPREKLRALEALTEQLIPGRWPDVRPITEQELKATLVLTVPISEASAKVSEGPPDDADSPDGDLPIWAGVIPVQTRFLPPVPDPALRFDLEAPPYAANYRRPSG